MSGDGRIVALAEIGLLTPGWLEALHVTATTGGGPTAGPARGRTR